MWNTAWKNEIFFLTKSFPWNQLHFSLQKFCERHFLQNKLKEISFTELFFWSENFLVFPPFYCLLQNVPFDKSHKGMAVALKKYIFDPILAEICFWVASLIYKQTAQKWNIFHLTQIFFSYRFWESTVHSRDQFQFMGHMDSVKELLFMVTNTLLFPDFYQAVDNSGDFVPHRSLRRVRSILWSVKTGLLVFCAKDKYFLQSVEFIFGLSKM